MTKAKACVAGVLAVIGLATGLMAQQNRRGTSNMRQNNQCWKQAGFLSQSDAQAAVQAWKQTFQGLIQSVCQDPKLANNPQKQKQAIGRIRKANMPSNVRSLMQCRQAQHSAPMSQNQNSSPCAASKG